MASPFTIINYTPPAGVLATGCTGKEFQAEIDGLTQRGLIFFKTAIPTVPMPILFVFSGGKSGADAALLDAHVKGNLDGTTGAPPGVERGNGLSSLAMYDMSGDGGPEGFVVVAPQGRGRGSVTPGEVYTGGTLGDGVDEFGGQDQQDYVEAEAIKWDLARADKRKICYIGTSRGGMQMGLVVANKGKSPTAAIFRSGMVNLQDWSTNQNGRLAIPDFEAPNETDWNKLSSRDRKKLAVRSVLNYVDSMPLSTKYLFIHGAEDETVSKAEALALADALQDRGADVQIEIIPGANHNLANTVEIEQIAADIQYDFLLRTMS